MTAVLVGAGRMGQRHLSGLLRAGLDVHVVDPHAEARRTAEAAGASGSSADLEDAPLGGIELAVLAETAAGRLERAEVLTRAGVPRILIEKPAEQSRERVIALRDLTAGIDVRCNHHLRTLPFMRRLREEGGPFRILLTGGAYGLACNGIHWLDTAVFLTGTGGRLLFGELEEATIHSPRGPQFCDYGGRGLFGFDDGSRLLLDSTSSGSGPMAVLVAQPHAQYFLDLHDDRGLAWVRDTASTAPNFRYGADYARSELETAQAVDLPGVTADWARGSEGLPTLEEAAVAHELLFDLLETGGGRKFAIT